MRTLLCGTVIVTACLLATACDDAPPPPQPILIDRGESNAIEVARRIVAAEGIDPQRYAVTAARFDGLWLVYFREHDGMLIWWPARHEVLVFDDGRTELRSTEPAEGQSILIIPQPPP